MKIDLFCHILPPAYFERMTNVSTRAYMQKRVRGIPAMVDLDGLLISDSDRKQIYGAMRGSCCSWGASRV